MANHSKKINFKNMNLKKVTAFILVIIAVLLVLFLISNIKLVLGARLSESSVSVSSVSSKSAFGIYKDKLLAVTGDSVNLYKKNGNKKWECTSNLLTPFVDVNDEFIIASDMDGASAFVMKDDNVLYSVSAENPVSYAYVNKKARSLVITSEAGYKSLVNVYDKSGNNIYKWYSGEWKITDAVLSDNNKNFAVSGYDISGNSITSVITIFDVNKEEYIGQVKLEDTFLYKLKYGKYGIIALTDKSVLLVDKKGRIKREYPLSGKSVNAFDFDDNSNLTLALSDNTDKGQHDTLVVLSGRLREKKKISVDFKTAFVDFYKGNILCMGSERICLIGKFGIKYLNENISSEFEYARLMANGDAVVTFSGESANIYKVNLGRW